MKVSLITAIALVCLTAVAIGVLAIYLKPPLFAKIPTLIKGGLIGGGSVGLATLTLYMLYQCLNPSSKPKKPIAPVDILNVTPPIENQVVQIEKAEETPQPSQVESKTEPKVETPFIQAHKKIALHHAMRLFKNYDEELANRYKNTEPFSDFLQSCLPFFPEDEMRNRLIFLIKLQQHIETKESESDLDTKKNDSLHLAYFEWREKNSASPFYFFQVKKGEPFDEFEVLSEQNSVLGVLKQIEQIRKKYHSNLEENIEEKEKLSIDPKEKTFASVFHKCLNISKNKGFQVLKKIYKARLLKQILSDFPEWKNDSHFKAWVKGSFLHLQKNLQGVKVPTTLRQEWMQVQGMLNEMQDSILEPLAPSAAAIEELHVKRFTVDSIEQSTHFQQSTIKEIQYEEKVLKQEEKEVLSLPRFATKEDVELVVQWREHLIEEYQNAKPIENVEYEVFHFLNSLPSKKLFLQFVNSLSMDEKKTLMKEISEIALLQLTLQVVLEKPVPHPTRFVAYLKTLNVLVILAQEIEEVCFKGFTLDTNPFLEVLIDNYLDLGPLQKVAFDLFHELKGSDLSPPLSPVFLMELRVFDPHNPIIKKLDSLYSQKKEDVLLKKLFSEPYDKDFKGEVLPSSFVNFRIVAILVQCLTLPHYHLAFEKRKTYGRREEFSSHFSKLKQRFHNAADKLLTTRELLTIDMDKRIIPLDLVINERHFHCWGTHFSKTLGPPMSPYFEMGRGVTHHDLRLRLAEGLIASRTYYIIPTFRTPIFIDYECIIIFST